MKTRDDVYVIDLDDSDPRLTQKAATRFANAFVLTVEGGSDPYMCEDTEDGVPISCDGVFQHKRLTPTEIVQVGVTKARLLMQTTVDVYTDSTAERMAYLQVALTETPAWWPDYVTGQGPRCFDAEILRRVYEHCRRWEENFREQLVAKRRARAESDRARTQPDGVASKVVV